METIAVLTLRHRIAVMPDITFDHQFMITFQGCHNITMRCENMDCILYRIKKVEMAKDTCTKAFCDNPIRNCEEFVGLVIVEGKGSEVKKQSRKGSFLNLTQSPSSEVDETEPVYQLRVWYQVEPCFLVRAECQSTLYKGDSFGRGCT